MHRVLHLIRNTFRFAGRQDWDAMARDLRPAYTAATETAAQERFAEFDEKWCKKYPAIRAVAQRVERVRAVPRLREVRRVIYSTNAIESIHARFRRATRARGHFPNEQAAMKCLYLVVRGLDPNGKGAARWMTRWKPALNAFAITFEGRILTNDQ